MNYPTIGEHVAMYANSRIIGNCHVGDNVIFAANSFIIDCDIPSNSLVFPSMDGRKPLIKPMSDKVKHKLLDMWRYEDTYTRER